MMELTPEEISKIIFYWHKHPYSAAASSGDEADTFDVFMPEDTERPYFGFMQTANKNGTGFEYEARIEMRHPIFCSITDVEMFSDVDVDIADACKKIIAEKITEGNASATDQTGSGAKKGDIVTYSNKVSTMPIVIKNEDEYEHVFEVKIKNGSIHLTISNYLEPWILELLGAPPMFDTYKDSVTSYGDELTEIKIKPKKRCGKMIFKFFKSLKDEVCYKEEEETTVEGAVATANQFKTQKDLNNERNNTLGNDETWQNYFPNQ